jgi:eukaryotic-like serine/threonine-protein kinase
MREGDVIGQRINNYEIVEQIGEGGMGAVYLARHPLIDRTAAVKVLRASMAGDSSLVDRFFNEAKAANAIRHPNIIEVLDVGFLPDGKTPYLMMELLEGESLAQRLKRVGTMLPDEAIGVAVQTASAVGAAHAKGIIHRDLKPENLFLTPDARSPGGARVKVLDFGIAKLRGTLSGAAAVKTQTGALMGTPPYMSPEQCRGISAEIDQRTDVYALGIILYEMVCGAPPFVGEGFGEVLVMHLTRPPEPPRARNPGVPLVLEKIILKALAKAADERIASMEDFLAALEGRLEVKTLPAERTTGDPPARPSQENPHTRPTTTLSSATGERDAEDAEDDVSSPPRPSRRFVFLGTGAAAVAAAIAFAVLRAPSVPTTPAAAAAIAPPPLVAAPPPPPQPPPPTVVPARPDAGAAPATTVKKRKPARAKETMEKW